MDGFPGVRNYGVVDPDDLYDVYCYAEELNGDWGWEVPRGRNPSPGLPLGPPGPLLDLTILCLNVQPGVRETVSLSPNTVIETSPNTCHRDRFTAKAYRQVAEIGD